MPSSSKSSKTKTEGEKPAKPKPAKREPGIYISEKDKADIIYSTIGGKHYELRKALEKVASRSNEGRKSGASDVIVPGHVLKYIELGENEVLYHDLERWLSKKYPGSKMLPPGLINLFALACLCDDLRDTIEIFDYIVGIAPTTKFLMRYYNTAERDSRYGWMVPHHYASVMGKHECLALLRDMKFIDAEVYGAYVDKGAPWFEVSAVLNIVESRLERSLRDVKAELARVRRALAPR